MYCTTQHIYNFDLTWFCLSCLHPHAERFLVLNQLWHSNHYQHGLPPQQKIFSLKFYHQLSTGMFNKASIILREENGVSASLRGGFSPTLASEISFCHCCEEELVPLLASCSPAVREPMFHTVHIPQTFALVLTAFGCSILLLLLLRMILMMICNFIALNMMKTEYN